MGAHGSGNEGIFNGRTSLRLSPSTFVEKLFLPPTPLHLPEPPPPYLNQSAAVDGGSQLEADAEGVEERREQGRGLCVAGGALGSAILPRK